MRNTLEILRKVSAIKIKNTHNMHCTQLSICNRPTVFKLYCTQFNFSQDCGADHGLENAWFRECKVWPSTKLHKACKAKQNKLFPVTCEKKLKK